MIDPLINVLLNTPVGNLRAFSDELAIPVPKWLEMVMSEMDPEASLSTVPRETLLSLGLKAWRQQNAEGPELAHSDDTQDPINYLLVCNECGHLQEVTL